MKKIIILLIITLIFVGCSSEEPIQKNSGTNEEIAAIYIVDFENKDIDALLNHYNYTEDMESALNETLFEQVYSQLETTYGNWNSTHEYKLTESGEFIIISYLTKWDLADLNINIVFDSEGSIAGFNYTEALEALVTQTEFTEEEITFGNEPFIISGTLSIPVGDAPFPAVILVHGSGPSDRNETVLELAPFKDIANYLTDHGIAVLRYDKRTFTYGQIIDPVSFTPYEESIEDTIFALEYLQNHESIDAENIYILGHSLGGYLIPRIASYTSDVAGYIVTAGSALPLEDLVVKQLDYIYNLDNNLTEEEAISLETIKIQRDNIKNLTIASNFTSTDLMGADKAYWIYLNEYKHLEEVKNIEKPLLFLQGEGDYQVTLDDFDLWKEAVGDKTNVTMISYPGINHFLYLGEGLPRPEQYTTPGHVNDQIMDDMMNFIMN